MSELTLDAAGMPGDAADNITHPGEFAIRCQVRYRAQRLGASPALRDEATRYALQCWRNGISGSRAITSAHGYMRNMLRERGALDLPTGA